MTDEFFDVHGLGILSRWVAGGLFIGEVTAVSGEMPGSRKRR